MAASMKDPRTFFAQASVTQFKYVLDLYEEALKLKAKQKSKNSEELLKLDKWYQSELPKNIKARGNEAHLTHEELVKCMKWKLYRGKFSPRLKDLIQMNTPRLCMSETRKAFRSLSKRQDLASAIQALCNLKGVGPAMASAILTAAHPDVCGFMADECLMAIPEIETIDYTTKELLNFVDQLKLAADRLNKEGDTGDWSPHKVEQALWAHFVMGELKKELLDDMPASQPPTENGAAKDSQKKNGSAAISDENTDSLDSSANKENLTASTNGMSDPDENSIFSACEDTNDSMPPSETPSEERGSENESRDAPSLDEDSTLDEPTSKKLKIDQ